MELGLSARPSTEDRGDSLQSVLLILITDYCFLALPDHRLLITDPSLFLITDY